MDPYYLNFEDFGTVGSFHTATGSNLIGIRGRFGLSAIIFQAILNEDSDGALKTYGPPGTRPHPLDPLGDATNQQNPTFVAGHNKWRWVGLVSRTVAEARAQGLTIDSNPTLEDVNHRFPVLQQTGAGRGFYVSTTATAADPSRVESDPARYWDAETVSYGALTPPLRIRGVGFGDFGLAIRLDNGVNDAFLYADAGAGKKVGESSRQLFSTLFPRNDQENHPVSFMVFPNSGTNPMAATPAPAIRNRIADLCQADNFDEVIGLMASGTAYSAFNTRNSFASRTTPNANRISTALQTWGYNQFAAVMRRSDNAALMNLPMPKP